MIFRIVVHNVYRRIQELKWGSKDCLIQKNGWNFWKSWNSVEFEKCRTQCVTVNGLNNHADTANAFADNFATMFQH